MEAFIIFWNSHDTIIIQILVVFILMMVIFLAARHLFSHGDKDSIESPKFNSEASASLSPATTEEIEKALSRVLESQNLRTFSEASPGLQNGTATAAPIVSSATTVEVTKLQDEMQKKEEKINTLERQLAQIHSDQEALSKSPAPAGEVVELKEKVVALESKLSEYEIISEDIADLSFFKEENAKLQAEIAKIRGETAPAGTPPAAAETASSSAPEPTPKMATAAEPLAEATATPAQSQGIDDDIMAQFAAAVGEQKAASAAEKANKSSMKEGEGQIPNAPVDGELMGKFEEFVKKN